MENLTTFFFNSFVSLIESVFAEGYIVLLIVGLLVLVLGLFIIVVTLVPIVFGPTSIKGTVAGAVKPDIKRTSVDQDVTTKKGMLFPVFQYTQDDGTSTLIRGSSGGTHVYKYKTGQHVNLIINNDTPFGEKATATDKGDITGLYWGFSFLAIGVGLIYWAWSVLSSLSLGFIALISIVISLFIRQKNKKNKSKVKEEKVFDFSKMRPVEEFKRK